MKAHVIVAIIALASVSICGLMSTFVNYEMMDAVNERLTKEEQFGPLGWYLSKHQRLRRELRREYQRLYPDGRLVLKVRLLMALMFVSLLICAWSIVFFGN
jgi:hypothetical protein